MPVSPHAIISDPDEVWPHLDAGSKERVNFNTLMEQWLNATTVLLERYLNRKIKARTYENERHDGNGRPMMYLRQYPVLELSALSVYDPDFGHAETFDVAQFPDTSNPQVQVEWDTGRLWILPDAPISRFTRGRGNIIATWTGGFADTDLDVFKDAIRELIAIRWHARGYNPREISRSSAMNTSSSFTMADFNALSPITRELIDTYKVIEV